jgi:hypothetical protein
VTYAGHYANAAGNLKLAEEPEQEKPRVEDATTSGSGFRRYPWAELIRRVWNVDPQECPKCGKQMRRCRTLRGEELQNFLTSINRLGYPGRPPPVPWQDLNESDDVFVDREFVEDGSQQFHDDVSQIPPEWDSSFAIA